MRKIDPNVLIKPHSTWKKRKITQAKKKSYPKQKEKVNPSGEKEKFPPKKKKKVNSSAKKKKNTQKNWHF